MKRKNLFIIIGLILVAGIIFYFYKSGIITKSKPAEPPKAEDVKGNEGQAAGNKESQADAGAKEEQEQPVVEISQEKQQLIGVKTSIASVKPLLKEIRTVGRIEYDERRLATVNMKFEGWVEKLHVDYTGKYVKKGEPLAEIYSPELVATQQEFLNVLKWAKSEAGNQKSEVQKMFQKDSASMLEAAKQRLRLLDITDEQIKKIEETGRPVRTLTIYSPVSGYIIQKMAIAGMRGMTGEKLFDIADLSSVWVVSDIYEYELPLIKQGQKAKITLSYFPGKEFLSTIDYIYPSIAGETRTAKVRFTISNPGGVLKPQMFTNVEIKIDLGKRLVIPEDAVIDTGVRQIVYVDKGDGNFEPREVMLGLRAEGMVEVIQGIKAGEKVASSATFLIDSEAQLKGVIPLQGHKH